MNSPFERHLDRVDPANIEADAAPIQRPLRLHFARQDRNRFSCWNQPGRTLTKSGQLVHMGPLRHTQAVQSVGRSEQSVTEIEDRTASETRNIPTCEVQPRYLLLAADDNTHGPHSGYTHLASYIQRSILITAQRTEPRQFLERLIVRALNSLALARWYRLGSLNVEWRAWRFLRSGFNGLVHFMWAERDWGFLDHFSPGTALCATFHCCPDTLTEVIQDTSRLQNLAAVILMSEIQRPFFESHGVPPERIHVIHHGVDCYYFSPGSSPRLHPFTVLSVGNTRRNFSLLRAVCALLEPYRDIRIKVVAPKARSELFQHMKNVKVVSNLSDDELRSSYRESSCLLMTAEAATANNAILEAMACGLPIVSENVGGIPEYTGFRCAKLCEPGCAKALTDSIMTLYKEPNMVAHMGLLARKRAEELDWQLVAERMVRLYESVLAEHTK